jgi:hypothetical protein
MAAVLYSGVAAPSWPSTSPPAATTPTPLAEVIDQADQGIQRVRSTPQLADSFLRHAGLSVA